MDTNSNIQPRLCIWTCHKCHRRYALGSTQRCIDCGHRICYSERNTVQYPCSVQFDFDGWRAIYNARRSGLLQQSSAFEEEPVIAADEEASRQQKSERLEKMLNGTYSCFTDCSRPNECFATMALSGMARPANQSSSSSSSEPAGERATKTPKNATKNTTKNARRRCRNFQKTPSPLSQEWRIEDVLDEEVDDDGVIIGGEETVQVVEGREEERV
ncbi:hypothetical protein TGAM01_v208200 [Trichoderma gamsii]|uniref:Uncharacterized protein n=1 Tax=Trichoderma gamsii TaxID=398673 RepID=A0A2P4ZF73_9HYPO|nr:hypothetical protein TGAM01_v208200 [Trichoderma gamsii]PON22945.1 hypothetical protein TGAM01_v208200 [Trichoderma gamsii]